MVDEADLVLTAEAAHRTRLLEERPAAFRKIFTLGQFVASAEAADPVAPRARAPRTRSRADACPRAPDHDIADPYRRGPDEARRAGDTMEEMLAVVVEKLRDGPPRLIG